MIGSSYRTVQHWSGWALGRRPRLVAGVWALTLVVVYMWWWMAAGGPWAPFDDQYGIFTVALVPTLAGIIAFYGILPRLDWVDLQAVMRPQRRDTIAAGVLVLAFAGIPPLVRWAFTLNPVFLVFVPAERIPGPEYLDSAAPFDYFWIFGLGVGAVLGATLMMISLFGRLIGPLAGVVCYAGLVTIQGYRLAPELIPRVDQPHSPLAIAAAILTTIIGLTAFRLSHSGARPLIR